MEPTLWDMSKPIIAGQVRHLLTVGAGYLIAWGAIQPDDQDAVVKIGLGVASWSAVALWSWWQKVGQERAAAIIAKMKGGAPIIMLVLLSAALLLARPADAKSSSQLWQKIVNANVADLVYAKDLADNVGSPGSKLRSSCYGAVLRIVQQVNGLTVRDAMGHAIAKPDPAVASTFEQLAEVADNLQPTSPLMAACAPVANALKMTTAEVIALIVSGGATLTMLGVALP